MGQTTPIRLDDAFDPDTLISLGQSYDRVIDIMAQTGELRSAKNEISEAIAKHILALAQSGERDPMRLTINALKFARSLPSQGPHLV